MGSRKSRGFGILSARPNKSRYGNRRPFTLIAKNKGLAHGPQRATPTARAEIVRREFCPSPRFRQQLPPSMAVPEGPTGPRARATFRTRHAGILPISAGIVDLCRRRRRPSPVLVGDARTAGADTFAAVTGPPAVYLSACAHRGQPTSKTALIRKRPSIAQLWRNRLPAGPCPKNVAPSPRSPITNGRRRLRCRVASARARSRRSRTASSATTLEVLPMGPSKRPNENRPRRRRAWDDDELVTRVYRRIFVADPFRRLGPRQLFSALRLILSFFRRLPRSATGRKGPRRASIRFSPNPSAVRDLSTFVPLCSPSAAAPRRWRGG